MTIEKFLEQVRKLVTKVDDPEHIEVLVQIITSDDSHHVVSNDIVCTDCVVCMIDVLLQHIEVNNITHLHSNQEEKVH